MIQLTRNNDPALEHIPTRYLSVVQQALNDLHDIFRTPHDAATQGSVVFIEPHDQPPDIIPVSAKPLSSLDGVYRQSQCLIGIILWGNSAEGVTIICPEENNYAPEIQSSLKAHL
jgi:hypothetical protein